MKFAGLQRAVFRKKICLKSLGLNCVEISFVVGGSALFIIVTSLGSPVATAAKDDDGNVDKMCVMVNVVKKKVVSVFGNNALPSFATLQSPCHRHRDCISGHWRTSGEAELAWRSGHVFEGFYFQHC